MHQNLTATQMLKQEIAAKAVAPHVTPEDIENAIVQEHYIVPDEDVMPEVFEPSSAKVFPMAASLKLLTICVLVLRNGFTVTGTSACASPDNFDADIGRRVARQDAVRQVWPLLGYALRDRLHHAQDVASAITQLDISARTCEGNAPAHEAMGNAEQAALSRANAASYRAAIARLQA